MIRVVVADDQTLVRQGVRGLLELVGDVEVVGEAAGGEEAVRLVVELAPDVAVVDVRMPRVSGLDVARRVRALGARTAVVLLTTFDDDEARRGAIDAGAAAFLLKDVSLDELADAVRKVAAGGALLEVVSPRAREDVRRSNLDFDAFDRPEPLSARELDVLRRMAKGASNREIAEALGIAEGTVKNHASNVLAKLGVRDRTRAVLKAIERGLI